MNPDDLARAASDAVEAWCAANPAPAWPVLPEGVQGGDFTEAWCSILELDPATGEVRVEQSEKPRFTAPAEPVEVTYVRRPTADELVYVALATMLHDHTGLSGTLDVADLSDLQRLGHLENCPYSAIAGPIGCEQDCTSTGTGVETLTAQAGCPHGAPITVRTGSYGTGGLLDKMIALGRRIEDERAWSDDDD